MAVDRRLASHDSEICVDQTSILANISRRHDMCAESVGTRTRTSPDQAMVHMATAHKESATSHREYSTTLHGLVTSVSTRWWPRWSDSRSLARYVSGYLPPGPLTRGCVGWAGSGSSRPVGGEPGGGGGRGVAVLGQEWADFSDKWIACGLLSDGGPARPAVVRHQHRIRRRPCAPCSR